MSTLLALGIIGLGTLFLARQGKKGPIARTGPITGRTWFVVTVPIGATIQNQVSDDQGNPVLIFATNRDGSRVVINESNVPSLLGAVRDAKTDFAL